MLYRSVLSRFYGRIINGNVRRELSNESVTKKRNEIFEEEKNRQNSTIRRLEKIEVRYKGVPEEQTLIMNKWLSTPYNCAMHMKEYLMTRTAVALVNGKPWDMHRPLEHDCEVDFLHFKQEDPTICNEAFWRTCSFVLGYIMERSFKPEHYIELCSFPRPDLKSGSFVYDVDLHLDNWKPDKLELSCLSREGGKLSYKDHKFERLEVDASVALKMFEDNRFKTDQIPSIASQSQTGSRVTLYRMGDHVDISKGPLISLCNLIGRFSVTAVHDIESPDYGRLSRIQGISLPSYIPVHFYAYERLCERSARLNESAPIPRRPLEEKKLETQSSL